MEYVSRNLHILENLKNASVHHKQTCMDPHCYTNLYLLWELASYWMSNHIGKDEATKAEAILNEMPKW